MYTNTHIQTYIYIHKQDKNTIKIVILNNYREIKKTKDDYIYTFKYINYSEPNVFTYS